MRPATRLTACLALSCLSGGAALPLAAAEVQLPIPNAGFEDADTQWQLADGGMSAVSAEQAASGRHSLKVADDSTQAGSSATSARIPVAHWGLAEIRGRVFPVSGSGLGIYVRRFAVDGKLLSGESHVLGLGGESRQWEAFRGTFWMTRETAWAEIWVHSYNGSVVTAYVDDLELAVQPQDAERLSADLAVIKDRLRQRESTRPPTADALRPWIESQRPDGSWPGIAYDDQGRGRWEPAVHMERIRVLATGFGAGDLNPVDASAGKEAALRALDHWLAHDYACPNWWYNQIGVPRSLYRAMLFLEAHLSPEQMAGCLRILERGRLGMTGQNLVWVAEVSIARACLAGLPDLAADAFRRIADEVKVTSGEGIQADFSFYQHGQQLYSGGYGKGFSIDVPAFAALAHDTVFAFPADKLDILSGFLLDGQQWLVRGPTFDPSACGREIVRRNACSSGGLAGAARHLAMLDLPRREELERFAARLDGRGEPLEGHKHFWRSDLTVHHRPDLYVSVRVTSPRLVQSELVNSVNLLGRHLADGVAYLMRRGDEYRTIFGVWDWKRLPGITVEMDGQPPTLRNGQRGANAFAGGVSDGRIGVTAMDFRRGSLQARKAWFHFDDAVLYLGSGIGCDGPHPVLTSINQCHLRGDVARGHDAGGAAQWVWHDGLAYVFPGDQAVEVEGGPRTGDWRRINATYASTEETVPVFSLALSHGVRPLDAAYAVIVAPAAEPVAASRLAAAPPVRLVVNETAVQAAMAQGDTAAAMAFYAPGSVVLPGFGPVAVERSCLVTLARSDGRLQVAVCDPAHGSGELGIEVAGRRRTVALPGGQHAGSSVVLDWSAADRP